MYACIQTRMFDCVDIVLWGDLWHEHADPYTTTAYNRSVFQCILELWPRILVLPNDIMIIIQELLQWLFGFPGQGLGDAIHRNSNCRGNSCAGPIWSQKLLTACCGVHLPAAGYTARWDRLPDLGHRSNRHQVVKSWICPRSWNAHKLKQRSDLNCRKCPPALK